MNIKMSVFLTGRYLIWTYFYTFWHSIDGSIDNRQTSFSSIFRRNRYFLFTFLVLPCLAHYHTKMCFFSWNLKICCLSMLDRKWAMLIQLFVSTTKNCNIKWMNWKRKNSLIKIVVLVLPFSDQTLMNDRFSDCRLKSLN